VISVSVGIIFYLRMKFIRFLTGHLFIIEEDA
jgi:hypothetical protein